jgi:host factor-I protein
MRRNETFKPRRRLHKEGRALGNRLLFARIRGFVGEEGSGAEWRLSLMGEMALEWTDMTSPLAGRRRAKSPPPGETGQEALYLRSLSDRQVIVNVKLRDGETVRGWIEYFDDVMVRLTREGAPNLFIYKHQIRSISEAGKRRDVRTDGSEKVRRRVSNGEPS